MSSKRRSISRAMRLFRRGGHSTGTDTTEATTQMKDKNKKGGNKITNENIWQAAGSGELSFLTYLIQIEGANVNTRGVNGWTPLHFAAKSGHKSVCQLLIESGAELMSSDREGWTPLHYAAESGHADICSFLIENGANVNAKAIDGWTPLHCAAQNGSSDSCKILLDNGADAEAMDDDGENPLETAIRMGYTAAIAVLSKNPDIGEVRESDVHSSECTICTYAFNSGDRVMTKFDCNHVVCARCASAMKNCHICNEKIRKLRTVYLKD